MDLFNVVTLFGGIALFLFGMKEMGDGLMIASGSKFRSLLERLTSNPLKAVLLGTGVTAIIQSSAATTVMVVGLVNAGLLALPQTVGLIMGANIGTTATAWVLSLGTIGGSSMYIRLLKPSFFSPVIAIIAVGILLFSKNEQRRNVSRIMIGFAILMFGMESMIGAVQPLAELPAFRNLFVAFTNPLVGLLVGAVLTAVIQSSSASIGILQALATTGLVTYGSAIPIIFGQNIGTCVTALISSIGTSKNAKRAALIHLVFNIFGTVLFMGGFYLIEAIIDFQFMGSQMTAVDIAIANTLYKICATTVFLPFRNDLVRFVTFLTPSKGDRILLQIQKDDQRFASLDPRFLDTPGFAVTQCSRLSQDMAKLVQRQYNLSVSLLHEFDQENYRNSVDGEDVVDQYEDHLGSYMVKVSARQLTEEDNRLLSLLLQCLGDYERISDHALDISNAGKEMYEKRIGFSASASAELAVMERAVRSLLDITVRSFCDNDLVLARQVEPLEEVIDMINDELRARHIKRLQFGRCTLELGFILNDVLTAMERVADHCSNIAISILELAQGDTLDQHAHLHDMKERADFSRMVREYEAEFALPPVEKTAPIQQLSFE